MPSTFKKLLRSRSIRVSVAVLALLLILAAAAPMLSSQDPQFMDSLNIDAAPAARVMVELPSGQTVAHTYWMGSDSYGRDIWSRVLFGTRVSLFVAVFCALVALAGGLLIGTLAGYFRAADAILMRVVDGLMAIPSILLAITLVAVLGASLTTVVVAIAIPELPRVARLVRSLVLGLREEPFVEAARALATPTPLILLRHVLPNALAPLVVQGTFIAASAILTEAVLSFLGLGLPPEVATWGNVMSEGRVNFGDYPEHVLFPALLLVPAVLAINLLGDGLRDALDPKFNRRTT